MALKFSSRLCTALAGDAAAQTSDSASLATQFASAELRIYGNNTTAPASADAACTGNTLICTITGPTDAALTFLAAVLGVWSKSTQVWSGVVSNAGALTAQFYRLVDKSDDDTSDTTTWPRIQGTIGTSGADLNMVNPVLVDGATETLNTYTVSLIPN